MPYMNKPYIAITVVASACLLLTGCAASLGEFKGGGTSTDASLNMSNYRVVKAGATGQSSDFRWLGLFPVRTPYATAKQNLYNSVGENLTGRSIALANMTEDKSAINLGLFTITRLTLTADVIEFTKTAPAK